MEQTQKLLAYKWGISPKVGKPELQFMCSAFRIMMFNICVKFHENMSNNCKLMEQTQKLFTTQRAITPKVGKPDLCFMCFARHLIGFNV